MHKDRWLFLLALSVVIAQSAVRLAVVPPWNHNDETTHYEMLRFIVERGRLPKPDDDSADILARTGLTPPCPLGTLRENEDHCSVMGLQFDEMPGYYLLLALGQWLFQPATAVAQLQLARLFSSGLAVIVAVLAWWTSQALFPGQGRLAATTTALLGVAAGYSDQMTALNNDVGAVAAMSFMVAVAISLIKNGLSLKRIILLGVATGCCVAAKSTAFIAVPLSILSLGLAGWPRLSFWLRIGAVIAGLGAVVLVVDWHLPAGWQVEGSVSQTTRIATVTPLGEEAFQVNNRSNGQAAFWQVLPPLAKSLLPGNVVTVGAWMRATSAGMAALPRLSEATLEQPDVQMAVGEDWKFYSYSLRVPVDWQTIVVELPGAPGLTVYYDGVVVAVGDFSQSTAPTFEDASGRAGTWNNARFENLIENGSAEAGWLVVRPQVNRVFPWGGINPRLLSVYDWRRTGAMYPPALRWQFVTFWTGFGGGHPGMPVLGMIPFVVFTLIALTGVIYGGVRVWRTRAWADWQWRGVLFLGAVAGAALAMIFLRIDPVSATGTIYYSPTGRYFYVAILPTFLLLMWGWLAWWPPKWRGYAGVTALLLIYGLGIWSLVNVQLPYFQGRFHF